MPNPRAGTLFEVTQELIIHSEEDPVRPDNFFLRRRSEPVYLSFCWGFAWTSHGIRRSHSREYGASPDWKLSVIGTHLRSRGAPLPIRSPMRAVGEYAECPIVPTHRTVGNPAEGIFYHFLPAVRELDVPLGKVAIMASWWVSLFNLARELRRQNILAVGPGSRPYKRSHLIAQLVEPIGAYLESPESEIAIAVQRSLFVLIATLTDHAPYSVFDFRGRVVTCKLLAEAATARDTSAYAIDWIVDAARRFSKVLIEAEMLSPDDAAALQESAAQMVTDIRSRDGGGTLTIKDFGIFARPQDCIQLLTVHKAKGREFEAVAVIEAHNGRFPHQPYRRNSGH